jgi:hypothetical protein
MQKTIGKTGAEKVTAKSFADGASADRAGRAICRRRPGDMEQVRSRWFDDSLHCHIILDRVQNRMARPLRSAYSLQSGIASSIGVLATRTCVRVEARSR